VYERPQHEYTRTLLAAVPTIEGGLPGVTVRPASR